MCCNNGDVYKKYLDDKIAKKVVVHVIIGIAVTSSTYFWIVLNNYVVIGKLFFDTVIFRVYWMMSYMLQITIL